MAKKPTKVEEPNSETQEAAALDGSEGEVVSADQSEQADEANIDPVTPEVEPVAVPEMANEAPPAIPEYSGPPVRGITFDTGLSGNARARREFRERHGRT